jgi:purine-binding chemotaxis protein CheW
MTQADRRTVLTFTLDGNTFALPVNFVVEIIDPVPVTRVPLAPSYASGVVNIRGIVAPVVDLRERLGLAAGEDGPDRRMLVLSVPIDGRATRVAVPADSVETIAEWQATEIERVPEIGTRWPRELFEGLGKRSDGIVPLLDMDAAFAPRKGTVGIGRPA